MKKAEIMKKDGRRTPITLKNAGNPAFSGISEIFISRVRCVKPLGD